MLNKKKNNKQEKLKQTQRTGLLFFTYMLVLFAGLTLVACPDATTSGSPESSGTDGNTNGNQDNFQSDEYSKWAAEQNGALTKTTTGTEITTVAQLKAISSDLAGTYYLGGSIDISGETPWTPIGNTTTAFTGTLHGNGYAIHGLTIGDAAITPAADGTADYQGLFGVINGATIDNLFIEVKHIYANAAVGALVGMVDSTDSSTSTLTNIAVAGMNTSAIIQATGGIPSEMGALYTYLGGVVGLMKSTGATSTTDPRHTISAYNYGLKVEATATGLNVFSYAGGIVGSATQSIVSGYATGAVSGINYVGGQVGSARTSTVSGYTTGNVSGFKRVGGQVGQAVNSTVNGYATGAVSGENRVGGQAGYVRDSTVNGYARGTVTRTSGAEVKFGMLVGEKDGDTSTISGFHSATESSLLDSDGTALTGTTGIDGTAITMGAGITQTTFSPATGDTLTFGTAVGEWSWVADGQWPAINLGLK